MRFTLGKLFLAVGMLALACAGVMYRTSNWSDCIFSLTIVVYLVTMIRAIGLKPREKVSALAFATIGLGYILFITMSIFGGARESLATNYPLAYAAKALGLPGTTYPLTTRPPATPPISPTISPASSPSRAAPTLVTTYVPIESAQPIIFQALYKQTANPELYSFFLIGHCIFSWLFAVLAAWFAGRVYDRRERAMKEGT